MGAPNGGTGINNGGDSNSNDDTSAVEPAKPLKDKDGGHGGGNNNDNGGHHEHDEHDDHHNHDHNDHHNHNSWCDHHDCHHHNHHTSTHFSDSHEGDVTVKINTKYEEKNPNNLEDVHLIIGDVYEKVLDLSDKPDVIKVDNLDIDGGDDFAVCLANEDSQEGDCM